MRYLKDALIELNALDLIEKNVNYNNNPILKWCLCNTAVKRDDNDNIRPVKGQKQRARIDGTVSLIIAYCVLFDKMDNHCESLIAGDKFLLLLDRRLGRGWC